MTWENAGDSILMEDEDRLDQDDTMFKVTRGEILDVFCSEANRV